MHTHQSIPEKQARLKRLIRLASILCFLAMGSACVSLAFAFLGRGEC